MDKFPPVIILAGGLGTRIRSLYPELAKAMIPVHGEPFIAQQLRLLARKSVNEVIICVGYRSEALVDYVGSGVAFGLNVRYSYDGEKLLGTGGAVYKAMQAHKLRVPFAVIYGDSYLETNFLHIYDAFQGSHKLALMTVYKNNNQWIASNLVCQSGLVLKYEKEKPDEDMQYVDYGLSIFQPQVFSAYSDGQTFDLTELFVKLIKGRELAAYEVTERFYEAGSPEGLKHLETYLSNK